MSLQDTPSGERVHIGLFGRRNAGKSSLLNGITGQSVAIVSEEKGTTTDPVKKAMELLPVGPVLWIDTPGLDDDSTLGGKRVEKTETVVADRRYGSFGTGWKQPGFFPGEGTFGRTETGTQTIRDPGK